MEEFEPAKCCGNNRFGYLVVCPHEVDCRENLQSGDTGAWKGVSAKNVLEFRAIGFRVLLLCIKLPTIANMFVRLISTGSSSPPVHKRQATDVTGALLHPSVILG